MRANSTSKYYGVRVDKRDNKVWYRAHIDTDTKSYYLGAYLDEIAAAYAFNVAFKIFTNGLYTIENKVILVHLDMREVKNRVEKLLIKKGIIVK